MKKRWMRRRRCGQPYLAMCFATCAASLLAVGCGSSHAPTSDSGIDAAADTGPMLDASCPDPVELAPGVFGGDCCADGWVEFERLAVGDGGSAESPRFLCIESSADLGGTGALCLPAVNGCSENNVCARKAGTRGVTGRCMPLAACNYIRSIRGESDDTGVCYYSDLTPVVTGVRPEVNCTADDVAVGICGDGCDCAGESFVHCRGSSELHPMGVCAADLCDPTGMNSFARCRGDDRCLFVAPGSWPAFWRDRAITSDGGVQTPGGYCVSQAQCDAVEGLYAGYWRCLQPGEVYTP